MDGREPPPRAGSSSHPLNMVVGPGSYGAGAMNNSMMTPNSGGMMQGMRLSFSPMASSAPRPVDMTGSFYQGDGLSEARQGGVHNMGEGEQTVEKKKRGRPRKYGRDGMSLALTPSSASSVRSKSPTSDPAVKRRGRPPGSGKKQQLDALGAPGTGFTPHVITVKVGEDIASKIMAFSQQGIRTVCILSANGAISDVTLQQPATSGGTVTYEGRFEIISLAGSFLVTEDGSTRSRSGGLSIELAGSDGCVLGGVVAGMLVAATPVQVVIGSFIAEGKKPKADPSRRESLSGPAAQMAGSGAGPAAAISPPSEGTSNESSSDPDSPTDFNIAPHNNSSSSTQHVLAAYPSLNWSHRANQNRHD